MYVGDCTMYSLSWLDIFNIVDASELFVQKSEDSRSGVRSGDLRKFDKMNAELIEKRAG